MSFQIDDRVLVTYELGDEQDETPNETIETDGVIVDILDTADGKRYDVRIEHAGALPNVVVTEDALQTLPPRPLPDVPLPPA